MVKLLINDNLVLYLKYESKIDISSSMNFSQTTFVIMKLYFIIDWSLLVLKNIIKSLPKHDYINFH